MLAQFMQADSPNILKQRFIATPLLWHLKLANCVAGKPLNIHCLFLLQVDGKSTHVPYRDSKLTRLLQGNLTFNVLASFLCCIFVTLKLVVCIGFITSNQAVRHPNHAYSCC